MQFWEGGESFLVEVLFQLKESLIDLGESRGEGKGILSRGNGRCKYNAFSLVCMDREVMFRGECRFYREGFCQFR